MLPGERIAAALDNVNMVISRGYDLREKEQEARKREQEKKRENREKEREEDREDWDYASRSLQERAMGIIQRDFPSSTEEKVDFQFQVMTVIENDSQARMFLALLSNQQKRWIEGKL